MRGIEDGWTASDYRQCLSYYPLPITHHLSSLYCFLEVALLDALRAESCLEGFAVLHDADGLQVRPPFPLGLVVRVTHVVTDLFSFSSDLTDPCHL